MITTISFHDVEHEGEVDQARAAVREAGAKKILRVDFNYDAETVELEVEIDDSNTDFHDKAEAFFWED